MSRNEVALVPEQDDSPAYTTEVPCRPGGRLHVAWGPGSELYLCDLRDPDEEKESGEEESAMGDESDSHEAHGPPTPVASVLRWWVSFDSIFFCKILAAGVVVLSLSRLHSQEFWIGYRGILSARQRKVVFETLPLLKELNETVTIGGGEHSTVPNIASLIIYISFLQSNSNS